MAVARSLFVSFDCADALVLGEFWAAMLGGPRLTDGESANHDLAVGAAMASTESILTAYTVEPQPDKNSLRALIRQSVNETADEGNVVIVSHAASYALADRGNVLRVLVTASPEPGSSVGTGRNSTSSSSSHDGRSPKWLILA